MHRLLLGLAAVAVHTEQLGAVDPAAAVDPAVEVASGALCLHGRGPFCGTVVLGEPLHGADQLAPHHPGGQRVDLVGEQDHGDLVEGGESLVDLAGEDAHPSRRHPTEGGGGYDAVPVTEVDRTAWPNAPPRPCRRT